MWGENVNAKYGVKAQFKERQHANVREGALFSDVSAEKTEARFLAELIKRLDCQMKKEHKNSPCPQKRFNSRLPSSSLTFMKCLFYLA